MAKHLWWKSICHQSKGPQKGLRPRQTSIQRGESKSSGFCFYWGHLFACFKNKRAKNDHRKIEPWRSGFSSPRACQWWSQNCRSPSGSIRWKIGFLCVQIADRQSSYSLGCFGHKRAECRLTDSIIRPTSLNYTQTMTLDRSITYFTPQEPSQPMGTKTHSNQDHFPRLFIF